MMSEYPDVGKRRKNLLEGFFLLLISSIFLYPLFALDRIKNILALRINGVTTNNSIWIIPLVCFFSFLIIKRPREGFNRRILRRVLEFLFPLLIVILLGGFRSSSSRQFLYSFMVLLVPVFVFFLMGYAGIKHFKFFVKLFVIVCAFYSIFAIILTTNYWYFMRLLGNPLEYRYYYQFRARMMLGSSITVGYYLNLTIPFCFYLLSTSKEIKYRVLSLVALVASIIANLVLLSRANAFTTFAIIAIYLFFFKRGRRLFLRKLVFIILLLVVGYYVLGSFNLDRLFIRVGYGDDIIRINSMRLGIHIFTKYPIIGSGLGTYFLRAYTDRWIAVDGISGLVDPHNVYILLLSETGLLGVVFLLGVFVTILKGFSKIREYELRFTSYMVMLAFLIGGIGGSHLVNEINFSIVFWYYLGLLISQARIPNQETYAREVN